MHTIHLLAGLAGLTLSVAAPTPGDANALELGKAIIARQSSVGDALICSPDINPGPCVKVPASGACTDLSANIDHKVRTIYQNASSHCEYFKSDNCQGRLGYSDARQSMRVTVPDVVGNAMGSAFCQRSAAVAEGATGEETGYVEGEFVDEEVA
ncbi:hypothetical protein E8E11_005932 [Didymella keratinophila]|nr:hypothetical protein E8E11_005932 [Didymella keratinophila]